MAIYEGSTGSVLGSFCGVLLVFSSTQGQGALPSLSQQSSTVLLRNSVCTVAILFARLPF